MPRSLFKVGGRNTNWMSFGKPKKSMSTRKVVKGLLKEWNYDEDEGNIAERSRALLEKIERREKAKEELKQLEEDRKEYRKQIKEDPETRGVTGSGRFFAEKRRKLKKELED